MQTRNRADIATEHKWNLADIYPGLGRVGSRRAELERRIGDIRRAERHARAGRRPAARGVPAERRPRPARLQGLLLSVAAVRRGPARQLGQRAPASRCRRCSRDWQEATSWFSPELLTIPLDDRARLARRQRRSRGLPLRHRRGLPPAGARARRTGRAAAVARRRGSRARPARRITRCRPPTRSFPK